MHGSREGNSKDAKRCSEEGGGTAEVACGLSRAVFGNAFIAREGDAKDAKRCSEEGGGTAQANQGLGTATV